MTDGVGTTSWVYDDLNRPTSITDPFEQTIGYGYDAAGNRTSLTYPNQTAVGYAYDSDNRLITVTRDQASLAGYQYDDAGHLTGVTRANGVNTTYGYDEAGHLASILHAAGNETLASYQYSYDGVGNRTQAIEEGQQLFVPPTETPTPTPTEPPAQDEITADNFESGDFSAWSGAETDNGDLSVTSTAAIEGSYGLEATINDQNNLYVYDEEPSGESEYHARFYFDPNSVAIPTGESFGIFQGEDANSGAVFQVELRSENDTYQIQVSTRDDNAQTQQTGWLDITGQLHAIQVEWVSASAPEAVDGHLYLWVDNQEAAQIEDLDSDTLHIDQVALGVLSPSSSEISGSVYFDDFASRRFGYIELNPNIKLGELLTDGFESGDFSAWGSAETDAAT